jgi:hypothetical protein
MIVHAVYKPECEGRSVFAESLYSLFLAPRLACVGGRCPALQRLALQGIVDSSSSSQTLTRVTFQLRK